MEVWYPGAIENRAVLTGGSFRDEFPARGVIHTTEGSGFTPSQSDYGGWHKNYPHFTMMALGSGVKIYQHIPIDTAARALRRPKNAPVETNRARAIQIEVVGRAAESQTFPDQLIEAMAAWMRWVELNAGVKQRAPLPFGGDETSGLTAPTRMSVADWRTFDGWCGHQHVPLNDHWDPGRIDINRLLASAGSNPIDPRLMLVTNVAPADALNARSEPDATSVVVHTFASTAEGIMATGRSRHVQGDVWLELETPGGPAWANSMFLAELDPGSGPSTCRVVNVASGDELNVRFRPGPDNPKVGSLPPGADNIQVSGKAAWIGSSTWVEVNLGATIGWANRHFLA